MNKESLEKAILDFNNWCGAARIYIDLDDGFFETSVYSNDLSMSQTFSSDNFLPVYSKEEESRNRKVGERRKEYIICYARLILDGCEPMQAKYQLANDFPMFF